MTCQSARGTLGSAHKVSLPANGATDLDWCYFGYPGENVWVTIDGKDYEKRGW